VRTDSGIAATVCAKGMQARADGRRNAQREIQRGAAARQPDHHQRTARPQQLAHPMQRH
jgi:hypothetical protein